MSFRLFSLRKITLLVVFSFLLTACSTRWVYNQLDWLIPWYLNDYVTIEDFQEPEFDASLNRLLIWHRNTQLPKYAASLEQIESAIEKPLTETQIIEFIEEFEHHFQTVFSQIGKEATPLMSAMTPVQKAELLDSLQAKNEYYAKEHIAVGIDQSRLKTQQKMQSFLEDYLGYLTAEQETYIEHWAMNKPWMPPHFYENRMNWSKALGALFNHNEMSFQGAEKLMRLFTERKQLWTEIFKVKSAENQQAMVDLILRMHASIEPEQIPQLKKRLRELQSDLQHLSTAS